MYPILRRSRYLSRQINTCYCSSETNKNKSVSVPNKTEVIKPEEPQKELKVTPKKKYDVSAVTKEDMQWRTPWHQVEGKYFSALRSMSSDENQATFMKWLQSDTIFSAEGMKKWWVNRRESRAAFLQSYIPERNQMLGNELAAAHFLVHRGGAVKFYGMQNWIKADKFGNYKLPGRFQADWIVEALDCSDMKLYYEGLANFRGLRDVKWFSMNAVEFCDDWYLDKISNLFSHSLIYLDIRNCPQITDRGIGCLYKLEKLKILCIDDMLKTSSFEMTCLMLQELNPELDIRVGNVTYLDADE